ncbi:beta-lactamase family protein [Amycolatopsis sp. NBC_01307]|uniref:serine hydrolase domain-containing protein n=1 Tax=Amycolatopsis sp. NBC_01307 TaxID=2903561 RepID=UPI002E121425|nr:beta-lactamase family protein [Amycolatopsis sp. NBC_01307]
MTTTSRAATGHEDTDPGLEELLREVAPRYRVPGVSVAIADRGRVRRAVTGHVSAASAVPVTTATPFPAGSVTKIPAAAITVSLLEQAGLPLDTPIGVLLPALRAAAGEPLGQVTVWHLLTHTSGLDGDHLPVLADGPDVLERYAHACRDITSAFPAGTRFSYCNAGFVLLGAIAERLTGAAWRTLFTRFFVGPLGLRGTRVAEHRGPGDLVRGHIHDPATGRLVEDPGWEQPYLAPAGLVVATAGDLLAILREVTAGTTGRFAKAASAMAGAGIATPAGHSVPGGVRWTPGWAEWDFDGLRVLGYNGQIRCQVTQVRVAPGHDFAVVVATNGLGGDGVARAVFEHVFARRFGIRVPPLPPEVPADEHEAPPARAVYAHGDTVLTFGRRAGQPVVSLGYGPALAGWSPAAIDEAPLVPVADGTWAVRWPQAHRTVAFDGPPAGDARPWAHYDARAFRLRP